MVLFKKIGVIVFLLAAAVVVFGRLPKETSDRIARFLVAVFIVGFAVRVGAYLLAGQ